MPFEPPFRGLTAVVNEIHREHFRAGHHSEKFRVVAEFHVVVRRGSSSAGELVGRFAEHSDYLVAYLSGKALDNAAFVQNYRCKLRRHELVQLFVICNVHRIGGHVSLRSADVHPDPELFALALGLRRYRQRRHYQDFTACPVAYLFSPFELHCGLSVAAVREYRRTALRQRPLYNVALKVE